MHEVPRLVIAGTGGDAGKTLVSLGLCLAWRAQGRRVAAFKKGPDYIDAAWLAWASGGTVRNLDTYLMGDDAVREALSAHADPAGIQLIEGNRGLYDGAGVDGTHSSAELAKLLGAPLVLVLDATKTTRTTAALVLGCQRFDPGLNLAGVILNRVAGPRHETVARAAIERACGIPVLGAIRAHRGADPLPGRHLGLVTVDEREGLERVAGRLRAMIDGAVDVDSIAALAAAAPPWPLRTRTAEPSGSGEPVAIGVLRDSAFTFYYPENLEALEALGATIVPISALDAGRLPPVDALYVGGGFPETHAERLSRNRALLGAIRDAAADGLPIYAECGGLMMLCASIRWQDRDHPMAGVLPLRAVVERRPQGHGYAEVEVDAANPFFATGTRLRGHEFHYSRLEGWTDGVHTAYAMRRGTGARPDPAGHGRDGLVVGRTLASYIHLHARGTPSWARGLVAAARNKKRSENEGFGGVGGAGSQPDAPTRDDPDESAPGSGPQ